METQLSIDQIKKINVIPNVANKLLEEKRQSFLKYIAQKTVVCLKNADLIFSRIDDFYNKAEIAYKNLSSEIKQAQPNELFCNSTLLKKQLLDFSIIEFGSTSIMTKIGSVVQKVEFKTTPQPSFNKKFDLLIEDLNSNHNKGYTNYIACVSEQQAKRFHDIFDDVEGEVSYQTIVLSLHQAS